MKYIMLAKCRFRIFFNQHAAHILKLVDMMCKYEMDPISILEDTERTWFRLQTDGRTHGRGEFNQYNFVQSEYVC